jgi:hypothetical protein
MKYLMLLALLFVGFVTAEEKVFDGSWDEVTERENGVALAPGELIGYRVYYSIGGPVTQLSQFLAVMASDTEATLTIDLPVGDYVINFAASAIDSDGLESDFTPTVTLTGNIAQSSPSAPTNFILIIRGS